MHGQIYAGLVCCLGFAALLIGIAAAATGGGDVARARLCQWSNAFFLLPVARALMFARRGPGAVPGPAAWGVAGVFFATFAASVVHHGCLPQQRLRDGLAAETLVLLWLGVVTAATVAFASSVAWLRRAPRARPAWLMAALTLTLAASIALLLVGLQAVADQRMDGCLWPHDAAAPGGSEYSSVTAPALARVWDIVDFVTAFSALVMAALFLLQLTDALTLGLFWTFAVLLTVLQLYRSLVPGGPSQAGIIAVMAVAGVLALACMLAVCCAYPTAVVAALLRQYDVPDVLATLLLGAAAITIFLTDNVPVMHSLWHVLGATALYFALEARYRGSWLFFGASAGAAAPAAAADDSAANTALL